MVMLQSSETGLYVTCARFRIAVCSHFYGELNKSQILASNLNACDKFMMPAFKSKDPGRNCRNEKMKRLEMIINYNI